MAKNNIMTTQELAEYIKLNEKTVIKMAQSGELPGVKVGNQWRFHLSSIDNYLQGKIVKAEDKDLDLLIHTKAKIIPLSRLIKPEYMELDLEAESIDEVLIVLTKIAKENDLTPDDQVLLKELKKREKMMSTAIGRGVSIPHPRNPSIKLFQKSNIVFVRLKKGINFNAPDGKDVSIFFMICAPNEFEHLRLLAKVAKLLHMENIRDRLLNAQTKEQIMYILLEFDRERMFFNDKA